MRQKEYRKEYLKGTQYGHGGYHFATEKFLQSRLGRPWSEVHSELSKHFDRRTYAGYTFWRWGLKYSLSTDCWIGAETGTVYEEDGRGPNRVVGYYVHPHTGILCYQNKERKEERTYERTRIIMGDRVALEKIIGIWYLTGYKLEEKHYCSFYNPWNKGYEILTKRQLNSSELRKYELTNNTAEEIELLRIEEKKRLQQAYQFTRP